MRRFVLFAFALSAATAAYGQQLTEKVDVTLVNVDVTVTTKGQAVHGLTKDDFDVLEDGVPQTITNFYAVENAPAVRVESGVAGTPAPAEKADVDERFRRKVLLIVDYAHTSKINRNRALQRLEQFIDDRSRGEQEDWSIALAGSDIKIILPPTSDRRRIHDCIEAMMHDARWRPSPEAQPISLAIRLPYMDPFQATKDTTYTAIAFLAVRDGARAFAGAEGKKIIMLLSAGFGRGFDDVALPIDAFGMATAAASSSGQTMTLRDQLIREANASNLNFYILDPEGIRVGTAGSMYWVARQTGGTYMGGNFPEQSLRQFDDLSSNFYSMAFRPQHPEDSRYHHLTVRLKKPGRYHLTYRDGYGSLPVVSQLERTLATPNASMMQASVIPISVTPGEPRDSGGNVLLRVAIAVPLKSLQFIPTNLGSDARVNLFISVFDADGRNLGVQRFITGAHANRGETTDHGDLIQNATLRLTSGAAHTIVVAVHDQVTDSVGVARQHLAY